MESKIKTGDELIAENFDIPFSLHSEKSTFSPQGDNSTLSLRSDNLSLRNDNLVVDDQTQEQSSGAIVFNETESPFRVGLGYPALDELADYRAGNSYLVSGYEKSGKSSFLLGAVINWLKNYKVAFFNTELSDSEFLTALTAISHDITKDEAESDKTLLDLSNKIFSENLIYSGVNQLAKDNKFEFEETIKRAKEAKDNGAKIFVFDNLTTYALHASGEKKGWEILASCVSKIISFTKENQVISFVVVHTKPSTVFNETPTGIKHLIEEGHAEQVFEKSVSVIRKPSGADIFGGGGMRSQLSGTILIWRPFQMFEQSSNLQNLTQVILENFRHSKGGSARFIFEGSKGKFAEDSIMQTLEYNK